MHTLGYSVFVYPLRVLPLFARWASLLLLTVGLTVFPLMATAQPPKSPEPKAPAFRLPDGTVIFWSKSPDDPSLPPDGVMLSAKEYQALLDSAEQLRRLKDGKAKPVNPSRCQVQVRLQNRGTRTVAVISLRISFQAQTPRTPVLLGGLKGQAVSAKLADGRLPLLMSQEEGLVFWAENTTAQTVDLELETAITPRGNKGELGFEIGLPKAPITTLSIDALPVPSRPTLTLKNPEKPSEPQTIPIELPWKEVPLGPADSLNVSWSSGPTNPWPALQSPVADWNAMVRIDDLQVETITTVRLQGPPKEWQIQTPPGAEVEWTPESGTARTPGKGPTANPLVRPTDPAKPVWLFRPQDGTNWTLVVTSRTTRPRNTDARYPGPYPIGPVSVLNAIRQTGSIRVLASRRFTLRTSKLAPELRPQDIPTEEDLRGVYRLASTVANAPRPLSPPWMELEIRPVPLVQRVQPQYQWTRSESGTISGWRVRSTLRITPPVGGDFNEFLVEVPGNWLGEEFGPVDLIQETIQGPASGSYKQLLVQLQSPQRSVFDLSFTALVPAPLATGSATIPMPRYPRATERDTQVVVNLPEGLQVRGQASEAGPIPGSTPLLASTTNTPAARTIQTTLERGVARLELNWQPQRVDLSIDQRVEITLQPRQISVEQSLRVRTTEGELKPFRLRGPEQASGWNLSASVESLGPGEWLIRPPAETKEWNLNFSYALPIARPDAANVSVPLAWADLATRTETLVRVWGGGLARRVIGFSGPWRELPPEAVAERPAYSWLTLTATGNRLPLQLDWQESAEAGSLTVVERSLIQAVLNDEGSLAVRSRFLLKRWSSAGLELQLPNAGSYDILLDGKKIDPIAVQEFAEGRTVRLMIPSGAARRPSLLLDVFQAAMSFPTDRGLGTIAVPRLPGALFRTPTRWFVHIPANMVPFVADADFSPDLRWSFKDRWLKPVAVQSPVELEQWLLNQTEADKTEVGPVEGLTGSQFQLEPLQVLLLPKLWWMLGCSLLAILVVLGLRSLRGWGLSLALTVLIVLAMVGFFFLPQPSCWLLVGLLPGLLLIGFLLACERALQSYYAWRVRHLPGFRRTPLEPSPADGSNATLGRSDKGREPAANPSKSPIGS